MASACSTESNKSRPFGNPQSSLLTPSWKLLGPFETANGTLLFGVSTAMIFAVMLWLIALRPAWQEWRVKIHSNKRRKSEPRAAGPLVPAAARPKSRFSLK